MTSIDPTVGAAYLKDVIRQMRLYKGYVDKALPRVADADLHTELDANSNSIAVIVKHVAGNLRSRYRDFLTTDGEKPDRHRDTEFEMPERASRDEVVRWWDEGWSIAFASIVSKTSWNVDPPAVGSAGSAPGTSTTSSCVPNCSVPSGTT